MFIICLFLSCLSSFILGCFFFGILVIKYYEDKFSNEFISFENLFPDKDK